jgi:hypothetical protein
MTMYTMPKSATRRASLTAPVRNRYFYGKLLDVYHFELETNYFNAKRGLLNRLVSGFGVVCGLNVVCSEPTGEIVVTPGVAIDKWGREIIVSEPSAPQRVSTDVAQGDEQPCPQGADHEHWVHLVLCYRECQSDPAPMLGGECEPDACTAGAIREAYSLEFKPGRAEPPCLEPRVPNLVSGGEINYPALVEWVASCPEPKPDPCIALADICVEHREDRCHCAQSDIDIAVRPIVYSNDLLFDLVLALLAGPPQPHAGKS